jgi:hypothetical protein
VIARDIAKRPYRRLPDPRELHARLWKDPEFHMRDAYADVIDKALTDAITGKEPMEKVADALSDILMTQVTGELRNLGLLDHFRLCIQPIKHIVLGLVLAKMADMKTRLCWADDYDDAL